LTALLAISHRRVVLFPVIFDGFYSPGLQSLKHRVEILSALLG
jgi:hypothetical protein